MSLRKVYRLGTHAFAGVGYLLSQSLPKIEVSFSITTYAST